jgi:hypothetical protein
MFGRGFTSAAEEFAERQMRREMEFRNSAAGRLMEREFQRLNSPEGRMMQEMARRMSDPMFQMMQQASEYAAVRRKELWCWFYRRTTGVISREKIQKAVYRLLELLFPNKFDLTSFIRRVRAALGKQHSCEGIVKVHSPPVRLIPKTLHPVDSVA